MPAPLNAHPDRCNILDITPCYFTLISTFSILLPIPSQAPCWYLLPSSCIQNSRGAGLLLWSALVNMLIRLKNVQNKYMPWLLSPFLLSAFLHQRAPPIFLFRVILDIDYFQKIEGPTSRHFDNSTSHGELKVGCHATAYLSEITCCPLWPSMTPDFTHALSFSIYRTISPFSPSTCSLLCLATAEKPLCIGEKENVKSSSSIFIGWET